MIDSLEHVAECKCNTGIEYVFMSHAGIGIAELIEHGAGQVGSGADVKTGRSGWLEYLIHHCSNDWRPAIYLACLQFV